MLTEQRAALLLGGSAARPLTELLDGLLWVSAGRPWQLESAVLTGVTTRPVENGVIVSGQVGVPRDPQADLAVELTLRPAGDRMSIMIEWVNTGEHRLDDLALGLRLPAASGARLTIPQVIYHDNPSADPESTIPHVGRGGFVTQDHRLPVPAVCAERAGEALILAELPSTDDAPRSLGAMAGDQTSIIAGSGVIMFDGVPDVDYVHKRRTAEHAAGYLTLPPGGRHRQQWLVERTRTTPPGQGFRQLIRLAEDLYPAPEPDDRAKINRLSRDEAIQYKTAGLDARWYEDDDVAGYLKFPSWGEPRKDPNRPARDFLYGWTGQCLRLAWCDAKLGRRNHEQWRLDRCRRVVDFYLAGSSTGIHGLRWNHYVDGDGGVAPVWDGFVRGGAPMISSRAHGETLVDLADIISVFTDAGEQVPESWTESVRAGADFVIKTRLRSGIVPIGWRPDGTGIEAERGFAGASAAQAVAAAARLTEDDHFRAPAIELTEAYHRLPGAGFERPYAFSTLDAACEDKESGMAYLQLLLASFELTGDRRMLDRAEAVADWLLTWVYHTSPAFPSGSMLAEAGFTARGWPGVSVQNHHLDVFFPTHDLWRLGKLTGQERFCRWAIEIDTALRQGICTAPGEWNFDVVGEQAEAFFVTDWQSRGAANTWNPSWVIALPLWNALLLEADDVLDPVR